ncbi:hypothetical protein ACLKA7_004900 [Drosophila subpalustris]
MPIASRKIDIWLRYSSRIITSGACEAHYPDNQTADGKESSHRRDNAEAVSGFLGKYPRHLRTGNYSAQANASERVNQSVLAAIRTHVNEDQTTWDEKLPEIQAALCTAVHASTGVSP